MTRKIYFEKRCIVICPTGDGALQDPNAVMFFYGEDARIGDLVRMFRQEEAIPRIFIPSDDVEQTYRRVCGEFREVNAAGGLVCNRRDDCLMIRRNGLWDLPKGHQEPGENIAVCAMREVQEETGVQQLELGDLICITDHCYIRDGIWHLKHTWWYAMRYTGPIDLSPQTEEDITKAVWVARSAVADCKIDTYPSIAEVLRTAEI